MVEKLDGLLNNDVVYIVNDKAEYVLFKKYAEETAKRIAHVSNVDELINEMEKIGGDVTFVFSDKLPSDVSAAMVDIAQIVDNLEDGLLNVAEVGKANFEKSLRLTLADKNVWTDPVEDVKSPVESVLSKPVVTSYWEDLPTQKDDASELARLKKDIDDLVQQKMEIESELITLSEEMKERGSKSDAELARVTAIYAERESALAEELALARQNLSEYQKMYAERSNAYEDLLLTVESLRADIDAKTSLIENDLTTREEELTDQLETLKADLLERDITLKNKTVTLTRIEDELRELREALSSSQLDVEAQRELFLDSRSKVDGLLAKISELEKQLASREAEMDEILRTYLSPEDAKKLNDEVIARELKIGDFNEQIKKLRIETRKSDDIRILAEEELERLRESYREMLASAGPSGIPLDEKTLGDDVATNVYYFKVISQPLYFNSFMTNFIEQLTKDRGNVLTVLIRDEDPFTEMYFGNVRRVNNLDEVNSSDKVVILKPSPLMFSNDDTFYNAYDSIVVVDFLRTRERYLKTPNGMLVYAFINEKEAEMHNVRGLVLSSGENSIIPMQYNKDIELALTPEIKKRYVQSIVRKWMRSVGLVK